MRDFVLGVMSFMVGVATGCRTAEGRPKIRKLCIGTRSRWIRGYRRGRLVFEGLVDEGAHEAKTGGWKMVFDGAFIPLAADAKRPKAETFSLHLTQTHVRTSDPRTELAANLIYLGVLEFSVEAPEVMNLPVRPKSVGTVCDHS